MTSFLPNQQATNKSFEFDALNHAVNYRKALAGHFRPYLGRRILEVGAGRGQFTSHLLQHRGCDLLAVEPDPLLADQFRIRHPQVRLHQGTLETIAGHGGWDSVVCINVLEHIHDDEVELQRMAAELKERCGHLCLFVPARMELFSPLDEDFGHFRRYHQKELKAKLMAAGFQVKNLRYFNLAGYFAWWYHFRLREKRSFQPAQVKLFDRLIFPPMHWLESRVLPPPIGQSLIAVAQAGLP